jgi:predicted nucleotidyltransferase
MTNTEIITKLTSYAMKQKLQSCHIQHIWLFGSRAKGIYTDLSDIDILYDMDYTQKQS